MRPVYGTVAMALPLILNVPEAETSRLDWMTTSTWIKEAGYPTPGSGNSIVIGWS